MYPNGPLQKKLYRPIHREVKSIGRQRGIACVRQLPDPTPDRPESVCAQSHKGSTPSLCYSQTPLTTDTFRLGLNGVFVSSLPPCVLPSGKTAKMRNSPLLSQDSAHGQPFGTERLFLFSGKSFPKESEKKGNNIIRYLDKRPGTVIQFKGTLIIGGINTG